MTSPDYLLRLLGGASIEGPEGPLTGRPAQKNALALMAVLATAPDVTLPRETITALLWPERDGKRARHLLNVTTYEIRKALGQETLVTANGSLRLNPEVVDSDVERFDRAVETEAWDRAAVLYAGPFLEGFHYNGSEAFERWTEQKRWRYERLYRTVLERRAAAAEDPAKAAERWRALLERDPASATATIGLMRALEVVDRRAEAIDVAHAHRILMLEEYGADPNPDVEELADRLREEPMSNGIVANGPTSSHERESSRGASGRVAAIAAVFVFGVALAWLLARIDDRSAEPLPHADDRVLVADFENRTGDPAHDPLGKIATDFIARELFQSGLVDAVPSTAIPRAPGEDSLRAIEALVERTGAGLLVRGAFTERGDSLAFEVQILDARTGRVLRAIEAVGDPATEPLEAVERARDRTVGALATLVDPRLNEWAARASQPPSYEAYVHFATGLDRFGREEFLDAARSFRAAASLDDAFLSPRVWETLTYKKAMWRNQVYLDFDMGARADSLVAHLKDRRDELAPWDRAMVDYFAAPKDDIRALHDALRKVTTLSRDPRWTIELARYSYFLNRPDEAVRILDDVDLEVAAGRGLHLYLVTAVNAHHDLEEFEQELEVARRWREEIPQFRMAEMYELRARASLGREAEVESRLASFLRGGRPIPCIFLCREFEIHGLESLARRGYALSLELWRARPVAERNEAWRMSHANLLYLTGDLEGARGEWARLLEETEFSDNHLYYIGGLGRIAARQGDRGTARRMERRLTETDWSEVFYGGLPRQIAHQRAQIAALLGERDRAVDLLRDVYEGGSYHEAHVRTMAPDLDVLLGHPGYRRLAMAGS